MWISGALMIAAALAGQEPPARPEVGARYGHLRAAVEAERERRSAAADEIDDRGFDLDAERPRLSLAQRFEIACAEDARGPDESEAACRERVTEAVIQESLARGGATNRTTDWTEAEEREWVRAPATNPADRLRNCRQSSQRSQDGDTASWSIRCGDQDGPASEALNRLLNGD
jgi:hypothetical protein